MDEFNVEAPLYPSLWALFLAGCFFWPGLFIVFRWILSRRYPPHLAYGTAMRLVSCVHAAFQFTLGSLTMSRTYTDIFFKECKLLDQSLTFATMYWFYDVVAMYMVYCREKQLMETTLSTSLKRFLRERPLVCVHHVMVPAGGYPLVLHYRFGKAAFMCACVQVTELSTPFINIRKILIKHHNTDSMIFKVNTVLAVATFFLTRVVLFPNLYLIYAYSYHLTLWEVATSMYFGCHLVMFCMTLMQVTWFVAFVTALSKEHKPKVIKNGYQNEHSEQNGPGQNGHQNGRENGYTKKSA